MPEKHTSNGVLTEHELSEIRALIEQRSGILFDDSRERFFSTRIREHMIAKKLGHKVVAERGLLECDFGEWTGAELKTLMKKPEWMTVQRYPSGFRFPGGESFPEMQGRIVGTMAKLRERHPGETVVAVSHADPIKAAVADAVGTPLDLFQRIVVSPCSVTAIAYSPFGPIVLAVNSTGALTELKPS